MFVWIFFLSPGGGAGLRERPLGRGSGELQEAGEDPLRRRAPHHRLHLLPGILHQTLQAATHGADLETLSQPAEGACLHFLTLVAESRHRIPPKVARIL